MPNSNGKSTGGKDSQEFGEDQSQKSSEETETQSGRIHRRTALKGLAGGAIVPIVGQQLPTVRADETGVSSDFDPEFTVSRERRVESFDGTGDPNNPTSGFYLASNQGLTVSRIESNQIGDQVLHQFVLGASASSELDSEPDGNWEQTENLSGIYLEIENDQSSHTSSILAPDQGDERMVGATQDDGDPSIDWRSGIQESIEVAVTELNLVANVAISSYNIYDAFRYDGEEFGDGQHADYWWKYRTWTGGADPRDELGAACRFYVEANEPSDGYDITVRTDVEWDHPKVEVISEEDNTYIGYDISASGDVTAESMVSVDDITDPYVRRKAEEAGVSEVTKVAYNDTIEPIEANRERNREVDTE
ncbi:hypothetical protein C482_18292 [Natrialba chahannaoensis JCM 10990]|uniref:Uncharacterized protein n=1 Tax=Natrialba chahannaoensis JCM 10990 TaxID=1227492 RepID=M0A696_9EURY|nr:hypothetical protein [Natrialba chahannaoensis]ELY94285.1 hypothetical protein C482_18292 [Natrialba chahannaoensis JCM 10990]